MALRIITTLLIVLFPLGLAVAAAQPPVEEAAGLAAGQPAGEPAQDAQEEEATYLRVTRDENKVAQTLETAIVRFAPVDPDKKGPTVDLIGAIHMAEPSYYDQLNKAFTEYDVVLYELVAEEGTRVPRGGGNTGTSPLGMIQLGMTDLLELEYQLAGIDYTAENLIHADMSPEEFSQSMEDRGESFFGMFLRMMGYSLARQQSSDGSEDIGLLVALFSKDRALALRRVLAGQFEDLEGSMMAIDGPNGSTLIAERNKVTLEELGKQIAAGKEKIAIFYGAGHMPDFADRIQEEFGLAPVSTRWLEAWTMEPAEE